MPPYLLTPEKSCVSIQPWHALWPTRNVFPALYGKSKLFAVKIFHCENVHHHMTVYSQEASQDIHQHRLLGGMKDEWHLIKHLLTIDWLNFLAQVVVRFIRIETKLGVPSLNKQPVDGYYPPEQNVATTNYIIVWQRVSSNISVCNRHILFSLRGENTNEMDGGHEVLNHLTLLCVLSTLHPTSLRGWWKCQLQFLNLLVIDQFGNGFKHWAETLRLVENVGQGGRGQGSGNISTLGGC